MAMNETCTATIALPTSPLEELSGRIGKLARTAMNEYVNDFWQSSILFLDILRRRGNQREEMMALGVASVLITERMGRGGRAHATQQRRHGIGRQRREIEQ
jgi:hypothetical protein